MFDRDTLHPHQLLDADQTKLLEGKGVVSHVAIVGIGVQQLYDQPIRNSALKEISLVKMQLIDWVRKPTDFTSHRGIPTISDKIS